jgi:hypothetical protein
VTAVYVAAAVAAAAVPSRPMAGRQQQWLPLLWAVGALLLWQQAAVRTSYISCYALTHAFVSIVLSPM